MIFNAYQDTTVGIGGICVVSCGHIFAKPDRYIKRPNGRSDFLLFYIAKGSEKFFFDSQVVAQEGSFVLFRPFERQEHICVSSSTSEFYFVHFNAPDDFDLFGFESSSVYSAKPSSTIVDLFEEIIDELQKKQPQYERICASNLFYILSLLKRKNENFSMSQKQYSNKISYIIQIFSREYEKDYCLDDYAKMCNMSKYHFLRIFKQITGITPIEYRNKIRFEHAKELLLDTNYSISEIGQKVGISSSTYFCDTFKKMFGVSPSQYRKQQ